MELPLRRLEIDREPSRRHSLQSARFGRSESAGRSSQLGDPGGDTGRRVPKKSSSYLKADRFTPAETNTFKEPSTSTIAGESKLTVGGKLRGFTAGAGAAAFSLRGRGRILESSGRTLIMGILNVTPDSFSDGGDFLDPIAALERARRMAGDGADIIDIGGESSRPGAEPVSTDEELRRVVPVVEVLAKEGLFVSVDTVKSAVAREALIAGAWMINDISALTADPLMAGVVSEYESAVTLMHKRGLPGSMQGNVEYENLTGEVIDYLAGRIEFAVASGIGRASIAIDPGLGFGKSAEGNFELISRLEVFKSLGLPVLVGPSRKSFIGHTLGDAGAGTDDRLYGTLAAVTASILNGASIVRVHDVKESAEAALVADRLKIY